MGQGKFDIDYQHAKFGSSSSTALKKAQKPSSPVLAKSDYASYDPGIIVYIQETQKVLSHGSVSAHNISIKFKPV